jgi:hypothetical protein
MKRLVAAFAFALVILLVSFATVDAVCDANICDCNQRDNPLEYQFVECCCK